MPFIDAAKLGMPQRRRRLIAVATLSCSPVGLAAAVADLQLRPDTTITDVFPDRAAYYYMNRFRGGRCVFPADRPMDSLRLNSSYFPKAGKYQPRPADGSLRISQCRPFSIADFARIRGWPAESYLPQYSQSAAMAILANSVPPPMYEWVGGPVCDALGQAAAL